MSLLVWNDSLSIKIPKFDEEHKTLIKMINDIHDVIMYAKGFDIIAQTMKDLVAYTQTHFKREEEFLKKYNYSEIEAHKEEHKKFVAKITMLWCAITLSHDEEDRAFVAHIVEFQDKYLREMNSSATYIQDFLGSWLINHVKKTDAKYGAVLHGKEP